MSPPGTLVDNVDIHGDETVAVYNSVQCPVMTCVHNCTLRRLEERAAGQDQNTGEGRH